MWPRHMQSDCVTQVSIFLGTRNSPDVDYVRESMYALQQLCVTHSCALSINTQQKADGAVEVTAHSLLLQAQVSAIFAKLKLRCPACIVRVETVLPQALGNTNVVMQQLRNLRVNHGH